jgi:hypothetical protein
MLDLKGVYHVIRVSDWMFDTECRIPADFSASISVNQRLVMIFFVILRVLRG